MNEIIPTGDRVFMSMVGPAVSAKSHLIFQILKKGTFVPAFDKIFSSYQYFQKLYAEMHKKYATLNSLAVWTLTSSRTFPMMEQTINSLWTTRDEISRSKQFQKIAIAGRQLNSIITI